jgi:hypothetical protein
MAGSRRRGSAQPLRLTLEKALAGCFHQPERNTIVRDLKELQGLLDAAECLALE